jgi:hypothetical protein
MVDEAERRKERGKGEINRLMTRNKRVKKDAC